MGWTQRHGLTIGGAFLLLGPLWGALRYALELSGHGVFVQSPVYPGTMGAIVAMVLDPPGWAIALLIAIALLLFFFDTHLWQEMPEPAAPIVRRPIASARKRSVERNVRRDNNGAHSLQPPTTIQYPRVMRVQGADRTRGLSPSSCLMLRVPDFVAEGLPLDHSDPGFVSTAALLERPAVKVVDIGFRSANALLQPDADVTRADAALFPAAVGIFRHLSNDDLKQHTASAASRFPRTISRSSAAPSFCKWAGPWARGPSTAQPTSSNSFRANWAKAATRRRAWTFHKPVRDFTPETRNNPGLLRDPGRPNCQGLQLVSARLHAHLWGAILRRPLLGCKISKFKR